MHKRILLTMLLLWATMAHAFVPEAGLWAIDAEVDGQPGRGFQIDVQGSTLVLTFYGYAPDGKAQWYLAAGSLASNTFAGSLDQFAGGQTFGAPRTVASATGSAGSVVLTFTDAMHGTIKLPGESTKSITRFNFARPANPLSLTGSYVLERAVVWFPASGVTLDSQDNFSASGTMTINGSTIHQSLIVTVNGSTSNEIIDGAFTDHGTSIDTITTEGVESHGVLIERGDKLITMLVTTGYAEMDHWRRISASPNGVALGTAFSSSQSLASPVLPLGGAVGSLIGTR